MFKNLFFPALSTSKRNIISYDIATT